jgi:hypothetical protein
MVFQVGFELAQIQPPYRIEVWSRRLIQMLFDNCSDLAAKLCLPFSENNSRFEGSSFPNIVLQFRIPNHTH